VRIVRALLCLIGITLAAPAAAQTTTPRDPPAAPAWSGSASLYLYAVPDDANFVQPTVALDRGWLHLEARFNYEDLDTASAWVGGTFSIGERVTLELTPMAGVVFGNTSGGAIGYSGSVTWRSLDLYSESEYVFASGDGESFAYTWSEFGWSPTSWLRAGLAVQRTRTYGAERDIQRGFFGAVTLGKWELSSYVFSPDAEATVLVGAAFNF
jgi:hypothetical protein